MLLSLVVFILVLGILVFVHELGHFLVAKWSGMRVDEFSLGYPPRIFKRDFRGTQYSIGAIPLGGYVRIHGENPESEDNDPGSFQKKPVSRRIAVLVAGVIMNLLLAFLVLSVAYSVGFVSTSQDLSTIAGAVVKEREIYAGDIVKDSPAEHANVQPGDQLVSLDRPNVWPASQAITSTDELISVTKQLQSEGVGEITLNVSRDGKDMALPITLAKQGPALGIDLASYSLVRLPVLKAPGAAVHEIAYIMSTTWDALKGFASTLVEHGKLDSTVSGPVGIYQATASAAHAGVVPVIFLLVVLSVNLALLNVLPFPPLDGGKLFFLLLEGIFRRRVVAERWENIITLAGFVILMALIVVITFKDIVRLIH
jgi:regulator of sigma E protease